MVMYICFMPCIESNIAGGAPFAAVGASFQTDANFGFEAPVAVDGDDTPILDPWTTCADGNEYDPATRNLADRFRQNFTQFVGHVDESNRAAVPPEVFDA
jgi:phosphoenolpyruvate carboxykinase (ATP)